MCVNPLLKPVLGYAIWKGTVPALWHGGVSLAKSVFTAKYTRICQLLVAARADQGLSQAQLARRLRRPQSFVSKHERRERRLDIVEFLEVASALSLDVHAVIDEIM